MKKTASSPKKKIDKVALAQEIAGAWKDRTELKATGSYIRKLRKGSRMKNLRFFHEKSYAAT